MPDSHYDPDIVFGEQVYDLRDINDRLTVAEHILEDLCRILTSDEVKGQAIFAAIHGFTVPKELSSRNATSIAKALEYCAKVKRV